MLWSNWQLFLFFIIRLRYWSFCDLIVQSKCSSSFAFFTYWSRLENEPALRKIFASCSSDPICSGCLQPYQTTTSFCDCNFLSQKFVCFLFLVFLWNTLKRLAVVFVFHNMSEVLEPSGLSSAVKISFFKFFYLLE